MIESHKMLGNPPKCERCKASNADGSVQEWCSRRLLGRLAALPPKFAKMVSVHVPVKVVGALSPGIMIVDVGDLGTRPIFVEAVLPEQQDVGPT